MGIVYTIARLLHVIMDLTTRCSKPSPSPAPQSPSAAASARWSAPRGAEPAPVAWRSRDRGASRLTADRAGPQVNPCGRHTELQQRAAYLAQQQLLLEDSEVGL
jgi:hypothetical protein